MRKHTRKLSLVAAIVAALATWSGASVVAQSEAPLDPMGASYWTGTWKETGGDPGVDTERAGYTESLGRIARGEATTDDSRMVGTWTLVTNLHFADSREPGEGPVGIASGAARIDNDEGAWVGTFTNFGGQPGGDELYVMHGEGAYEGLTTVFRFHGDGSVEGVILPAELPAPPDPVAPPTE